MDTCNLPPSSRVTAKSDLAVPTADSNIQITINENLSSIDENFTHNIPVNKKQAGFIELVVELVKSRFLTDSDSSSKHQVYFSSLMNTFITNISWIAETIFLVVQAGDSETPVAAYLNRKLRLHEKHGTNNKKLSKWKQLMLILSDWEYLVPYWLYNLSSWLCSIVFNLNILLGVFTYMVSTLQQES